MSELVNSAKNIVSLRLEKSHKDVENKIDELHGLVHCLNNDELCRGLAKITSDIRAILLEQKSEVGDGVALVVEIIGG